MNLWPPLLILRQALATCITTYLAVRWSRDRYGTWYGRPYGRNAAGTASLQGRGMAVLGQMATSVDGLDGAKRRSRARDAAKLEQQHLPAGEAALAFDEWEQWGELQKGRKGAHAGGIPSGGGCGTVNAAGRPSAVPPASAPPPSALATGFPEAAVRHLQPVPPPPNSPAAATCQPSTAPAPAPATTVSAPTATCLPVAANAIMSVKPGGEAGNSDVLRAGHHSKVATQQLTAGPSAVCSGAADGSATCTVGAHCAATRRTRPRYRGVVSVRTVTYKIPGYHPGDIPPGYVQRLAAALLQQQQQGQQQQQLSAETVGGAEGVAAAAAAAATPRPGAHGGTHVQLKATYVREGCIELVLYLAERVQEDGGSDGEDAAAGVDSGVRWQDSPKAGERRGEQGPGGGTAFGERGGGEAGVRCWQLDRGSGVCRRLQAGEGGKAWSVGKVLGALKLPHKAAPLEGSGAEAGGQQGRERQGSGVGLGAGAGEGQELVAVEVSPRVVLVGAAADAGGSAEAVGAPVRLQLTVTHSAAGNGGGLAAADTQVEAQLVLLQQQQQQHLQGAEVLEGWGCRLVPCRMTLRGKGAPDTAGQYGSGGATTRTVYDVEADMGGLACGPGPVEVGCGWLGGLWVARLLPGCGTSFCCNSSTK